MAYIEEKLFGKKIMKDDSDEDDNRDIPGQMRDMGYDSHDIDKNLGTILGFIMLWVLRVILYFVQGFIIYLMKKFIGEEDIPDEEGGEVDYNSNF